MRCRGNFQMLTYISGVDYPERKECFEIVYSCRGHRCRPFSPPVLAFNFYRAQGSAIPLLVDFSSNVANSRSRALRKSICAQEKVPTNLCEYGLERIRTHEKLTYTRLEDDLIRHRGDRRIMACRGIINGEFDDIPSVKNIMVCDTACRRTQ